MGLPAHPAIALAPLHPPACAKAFSSSGPATSAWWFAASRGWMPPFSGRSMSPALARMRSFPPASCSAMPTPSVCAVPSMPSVSTGGSWGLLPDEPHHRPARGAARSEGDVPVLARGARLAVGRAGFERSNELRARLLGLDHVVDVALLRGHVGVRERLAVLAHEVRALARGVRRGRQLLLVKDVDGALGAHDGDLRRGPRDVVVRADVQRRV